MHRAPQSFSPESTSLHRRNDPTSLDLIQTGVQQLKAQTASIDAEAKALQAQAMRLHPAVRRCEPALTARPWFSGAAALFAILIGAGATWLVRLAL